MSSAADSGTRLKPASVLQADRIEPIRLGKLETRLARLEEEVDAAQALRYRVFYEEMEAVPTPEMRAMRRDSDRFDDICDHILVIDSTRSDLPFGVVGTYRLLRRSVAKQNFGFYTSDEFNIGPVSSVEGEILELGRACVEAEYRTRPSIQLLWQFIAQYVFCHDITLLFGCASLQGTDSAELAVPLSYLYHFHLAPPHLRPLAIDDRRVDMCMVGKDEIDPRRAMTSLPTMIKGYLRLGGFVGDGAVIDPQFNTTDVCIVVKTDLVTEKYYSHYDRRRQHDGDAGC